MSIINSLFVHLRDWSLKDYPVTVNCALCGELPRPLKRHYCVSVDIKEIIDVVIVDYSYENVFSEETIKSVIAKWRMFNNIGDVFLLCHSDIQYKDNNEFRVLECNTEKLPYEAYIYEYGVISEYYIIVEMEFIKQINIDPYNFFACNLLPLLLQNKNKNKKNENASRENMIMEYLIKKGISGEEKISPSKYAYGNSKENCKKILDFYAEPMMSHTFDSSTYRYALQQWAYVNKEGIIAREQDILSSGEKICA